MTIVNIPAPFREHTQGQHRVQVEGKTVGEGIAHLILQHPGLARIRDDQTGAIKRQIGVYFGDEDIHFLNRLETPLREGVEISIVPAIAGG